MSFNYSKAGANFSPAYQTAGVPHITSGDAPATNADPGQALRISFDYVTRNIKFKNTDGGSKKIRLAFTATGSLAASNNNIVVSAGETVTYDFRCKDIFLMCTSAATCPFELVAGLTTIPSSSFPVLTGSILGVAAFDGVG